MDLELERQRDHLTFLHGDVWDTDEMRAAFTVMGFSQCICVVKRKCDGMVGSLNFTHSPRFYFDFVPDHQE